MNMFDGLRKELEEEFDLLFLDVGDGWLRILQDLRARLEEISPGSQWHSSIKEKFGELRIDGLKANRGLDEQQETRVKAAVALAEEESEKTCMRCGQPGWLIQGEWVFVLCERCEVLYKKHGGEVFNPSCVDCGGVSSGYAKDDEGRLRVYCEECLKQFEQDFVCEDCGKPGRARRDGIENCRVVYGGVFCPDCSHKRWQQKQWEKGRPR